MNGSIAPQEQTTEYPISLAVDLICTDGGTQSRAQLDWLALDEYATAMRGGATFPPIVVYFDGSIYWLADGFHRVQSAHNAELTEIAATVKAGSKRDAILYSVGANNDHGVRRTNRDKRKAVELLLKDEEWAGKSDRWIAETCGVSHQTVANIREINCQILTVDAPREGKDGKKRKRPKPVADSLPDPAPLPDWLDDEPIASAEPQDSQVAPVPEVDIIRLDACFLSEYVDDPVHLVVTSPPYNVGIDYNHHPDKLSSHLDLLRTVWAECYKVMADGARIAVVVPFGVGRNPWVPFAGRIMDTLTDTGFTLRGQIIWDKNTTGNRTSWGSFRLSSDPALRDTTEAIIVAHKGSQALTLPDGVKLRDDKGTYIAPLADGDYFMELAQDHWAVPPESATRIGHPAPFPVELVKRLIHFYAFPGAHILDPFGGSGTTGIAARQCGCVATLIEIDEEYSRLAKERLANGYE